MILYPENIDKQEVATLPLNDISGKITVIDHPNMVNDAVDKLLATPVIGFDTETRPTFRKGEQHTVSLLQLATNDECFLFRLHLIGPCEPLRYLLENNKIMKIGLSVHDDFRALNKWMPMMPNNFLELQRYVKSFGIEEMSLQKIYAIVFNQKISKRQQLSNWEAPVLTEGQKQYAATDAWACLNIYYELQRKFGLSK